MSEPVARPRWHDALFLVAVALVLLFGLCFYGVRLSERPVSTPSDTVPSDPAPRATARLDSAPASQQPPSSAPTATCWDGRATTSLALCGLPVGAAGLKWVFPSFAAERDRCRRADRPATSYATVQSFECFERAGGQPVTVTYDEVVDVQATESWFQQVYGREHYTAIPGAHGGRCLWVDPSTTPVRITGMYERFPFAVTVYAPTRALAEQAWGTLVRQRAPRAMRGVAV